MKPWALHAGKAPGLRCKCFRGTALNPLCGQQTGYGAKGCDQALIARRPAEVTCRKCLKLQAGVGLKSKLTS